MPGRFCEAIVTTNSGSAMPSNVGTSRLGTTGRNTGTSESASASPKPAGTPRRKATSATSTTSATGTAATRLTRPTAHHVSSSGAASASSSPSARTGARQSVRRIPASIALASDAGIDSISRPSGRTAPAAIRSSPHAMNAPTAASKLVALPPETISSAAPGADQAAGSGMRRVQDSHIPDSPHAIRQTPSPVAAWVSLAPTAPSPWSTITKVLAKPTIAMTTPVAVAPQEASASAGRRARAPSVAAASPPSGRAPEGGTAGSAAGGGIRARC